jgi:hypothetical protein
MPGNNGDGDGGGHEREQSSEEAFAALAERVDDVAHTVTEGVREASALNLEASRKAATILARAVDEQTRRILGLEARTRRLEGIVLELLKGRSPQGNGGGA